jgi:hypothetical protein
MIENNYTMKSIVYNINDKMESISREILSQDKSYLPYLDEKLKSIEYDVKVLRRIIDENTKTN